MRRKPTKRIRAKKRSTKATRKGEKIGPTTASSGPVDPMAVLAEVAGDRSAGSTARTLAAKAIMRAGMNGKPGIDDVEAVRTLKETVPTDDEIPFDGEYRQVLLHKGQSERRLAVVRKNIDLVCGIGGDVAVLMRCLRNADLAPEARICAAAKLLALHDAASKARDPTPIDRDLVSGLAGVLRSTKWRSSTHYGSFLGGIDASVERDPLDEPIE